MKKKLYLNYSISILLVFLFFACGKKEEKEVEIPSWVLNEKTFTKVLADFALAESAANLNIKNVVTKLDSVYAFDPLKENNIRETQYDSAIAFYVSRPGLYKRVYENVLVQLSEMQAKRNPALKDSTLK